MRRRSFTCRIASWSTTRPRPISPADTVPRRGGPAGAAASSSAASTTATRYRARYSRVWMRLLGQVEGSVLWLSQLDRRACDNLRAAARAAGVDPGRIVFAPRMPAMADHLARHRLADLFLDTPGYNAHTTASDALWAGLPVLTCIGTTFAGRVAASLLQCRRLAGPGDRNARRLRGAGAQARARAGAARGDKATACAKSADPSAVRHATLRPPHRTRLSDDARERAPGQGTAQLQR